MTIGQVRHVSVCAGAPESGMRCTPGGWGSILSGGVGMAID